MSQWRLRQPLLRLTAFAALAAAGAACSTQEGEAPPVATPSVTLSRDRAPGGSPIDITYTFVVAPEAKFTQNLRVLVHMVDTDEELMWTDDHDPPVPTTEWKPGQTVEYTRTVFVPIFPYVGEAYIQVGLHSIEDQARLPMSGTHVGQREYRVARFQLLPQTENVFTVFKDGWHPPEVAGDNANVEWQWARKEATLAFKNPRQPATFYLDMDNPSGAFPEGQRVTIGIGSETIEEIALKPGERMLRKIPLSVAQLGAEEMVELRITVDKTFVPALVNLSPDDKRELGVRVFHAFIQPVK